MQKDLKLIKKYYGENMTHLVRDLFPTILENEGKLFELINSKYAHSKSLYGDIVNSGLEEKFKSYIYSLYYVEKKETKVSKTPFELMDEAGYILYECKTKEDVEQFIKYYKEEEKLCTFNDIEGRLDKNYIFWAVKKDVDDIKREDFDYPEREDLYGISVISLQFTKGEKNILSIKNRYNHRVNNPDATFSNNLDNIMSGLTESFNKYFNLNVNENYIYFYLPDYVRASDEKFYKYNYEINNIYYCENNIIIDNFDVVKDYSDKTRYIVADYFILDLKKEDGTLNDLKLYDDRISESFINDFKDTKKITIRKENNNHILDVKTNNYNIEMKIDNLNRIISYKNNDIKNIPNNYLRYSRYIKEIEINNVSTIGDCFMDIYPTLIKKINLPNVSIIGDNFMYDDRNLKNFIAPNLEIIGNSFLKNNQKLIVLNIPNLKIAGDYFLTDNQYLEQLYLPNLEKLGYASLYMNERLKVFEIPTKVKLGNLCLSCNHNVDLYEKEKQKVKRKKFN